MITFNFHTQNGIKDFQIVSPESQYTFRKGDEIYYEHESFIVNSVEYQVSEKSIEQIVSCEPKHGN